MAGWVTGGRNECVEVGVPRYKQEVGAEVFSGKLTRRSSRARCRPWSCGGWCRTGSLKGTAALSASTDVGALLHSMEETH